MVFQSRGRRESSSELMAMRHCGHQLRHAAKTLPFQSHHSKDPLSRTATHVISILVLLAIPSTILSTIHRLVNRTNHISLASRPLPLGQALSKTRREPCLLRTRHTCPLPTEMPARHKDRGLPHQESPNFLAHRPQTCHLSLPTSMAVPDQARRLRDMAAVPDARCLLHHSSPTRPAIRRFLPTMPP